jgi:hypothetical protein
MARRRRTATQHDLPLPVAPLVELTAGELLEELVAMLWRAEHANTKRSRAQARERLHSVSEGSQQWKPGPAT